MDTRFEVTKSRLKLKFVLFEIEIEMNLQDMEVVAPFSFDKDIHDKIGTNKCNKIDRSGEGPIKEEEKALTGREDKKTTKTV